MSKKKNAKLGVEGLGEITFLKSRNRYRGRIVIGEYDNGTRKYKTVFGETRKEVVEKLTVLKYQIMSGAYIQVKSKETVGSFGEKINNDDLELGIIKEVSYFRRQETMKLFGDLYDMEIQKVTEDDIISFFKLKTTYAKSTLSKIYQLLNMIFRIAVKKEIIEENPMKDIKKPNSKQISQKVRAMTLNEQNKFIKVLKETKVIHHQQMYLSMLTGMRMGEINALEVNDVDFEEELIRIRKTVSIDKHGFPIISETAKTSAGNRVIRMSDSVKKLLKECIGSKTEGLIFISTKGKILATDTVTTIFRTLIKDYDIQNKKLSGKLTLHSLRHTYATRCIESGMPAKVLQKILGHTDIKVTMNTYCDAFEDFTDKHFDIAQEYMVNNGIVYA